MNEHDSFTGARHLGIVARRHGKGSLQFNFYTVRVILAVLVFAAAAGAILTIIVMNWPGRIEPNRNINGVGSNVQAIEELSQLPEPDLLRPLSANEAMIVNSGIPILKRSDFPSAGFIVDGDMISKTRAVDCLTQAIYYEAASEGADGGRAVAQIVLNRMRHAGYPNSVCGVVYQGSTRATGCQFSFTCDGSLSKVPLAYLWARSRLIATEALAGRVFAPVGHATHYHADYVLPYWASSLDKVAVLGRHIFYRLKGASGAVGAFRQRYASIEPALPKPTTKVIEQSLDAVDTEASNFTIPDLPNLEEDRVETIGPVPKAATSENMALTADLTRGTLMIGEPGPATTIKIRPSETCTKNGTEKLRAIEPNKMTSATPGQSC